MSSCVIAIPDPITDASMREADHPAQMADFREPTCVEEDDNLVQAWLDLLGEVNQRVCKPASS